MGARVVRSTKYGIYRHVCPNELYWQQIDEIDIELKKYDTHVSGTLKKSHKGSEVATSDFFGGRKYNRCRWHGI